MDGYARCDVCENYNYGCMSFCVLVSTMGSRASRRQKTSPSFRVCKDCRKLRKVGKLLISRVRDTVRALKKPIPKVKPFSNLTTKRAW